MSTTIVNEEKLPARVLARAIEVIRTQGKTPASPGEKKIGGGVTLCAAAALAHAGLEIAGDTSRLNRFEAEIVTSKSSDSIRTVFQELGWSVELCDHAVAKNDSLQSSQRSAGVIQYLQELSTC